MVSRRIYDLMYRWWTPWDAVGVRDDLRLLLDTTEVTPSTHPRAVDLGCGSGANVVHLAQRGFEVTGIDFSQVALDRARARARDADVADRCRFVAADLTDPSLPATLDTFDLLTDFGTLDDLKAPHRRAMVRNVTALTGERAVFLLWCFYAAAEDLPLISFSGPSRLASAIEPGEEQALFGEAFEIEHLREPDGHIACFVLSRR